MIYVIAILNVAAGKADLVKQAALPLIKATQAEDGCIDYELHADISNENRLVFVERWESREALEAHFGTPHIAAFSGSVKPYIDNQEIQIVDARHVEIN